MKKIVAICVICAILVCVCGCAAEVQSENANQKETSMFVKIESTTLFDVVYHKNTKVMYAISRGMYNQGTFTLLVNADGTPMLWESGEGVGGGNE